MGFNIDIGKLSEPATVLVQRISDAIEGYYRPYQIKRIAEAEAEADRIRTISQIEITEIQRRAVLRFVAEESKKQANMESVTTKALPELEDNSRPQDVEEDWLVHFFDKCRLVSDDEMQQLWARVLAGEANSPGHYSLRTITALSTLSKDEGELFQNVCSHFWLINNAWQVLVYDHEDRVYQSRGITFPSLTHLDDIGLISYDSLAGFQLTKLPKRIPAIFCKDKLVIEFKSDENNSLDLGHVMMTRVGKELAQLFTLGHKPEFKDYVIERWRRMGHKVLLADGDASIATTLQS